MKSNQKSNKNCGSGANSKQPKQNQQPKGNGKGNMRGKQGRKDSDSPRVNYDNAREDKVAKQISEDMRKKEGNPPEWHFRNPELMKSASSIPFASILGDPVFNVAEAQAVPGLMVIGYCHAYGSGPKPIAINQASDANYSFIVHENSRDYNQTAPDYTILTVCGMDVFSILASVIRAYGTAKAPMYKEENLYKPDTFLRAQGFDPSDVRKNLGAMWFDINNFIDQSRQIWIPNIYPLMERWYWLNSNIYQDAEGPRASSYMFVQNQYVQYDEVFYKTGGSARAVYITIDGKTEVFDPTSRTYTWEQWRTVVQGMIDALINAEDRGMIYGNILKAYGPQRLYELQPIAADYAIDTTYNAEVLAMIENITITKQRVFGLLQVEEDLYPIWSANVPAVNGATESWGAPQKSVLNFHVSDQPSNELIVEGTRMTTLGLSVEQVYPPKTTPAEGGVVPTTQLGLIPSVVCSEVANSITIWYYSIDQNGSTGLRKEDVSQYFNATGNPAISVSDMSSFDWHPFVYQLGQTTSTGIVVGKEYNVPMNAFGDYDNYTVLERSELKKMHDADMFSLWGVPVVLTRQTGNKE